MKKLFLSFMVAGLCLGSASLVNAQESEDLWAKLDDPKLVRCSVHGTNLRLDVIEDRASSHKYIFYKSFPIPSDLQNVYNLCMTSVHMAIHSNKAVYLNMKTGETMPEDGFFQRRSSK